MVVRLQYEGVSKSFRTGRLEPNAANGTALCHYMQLCRLVSFAAISLYVASQQVFIVVSVYFVVDSVRKLLDTPSYTLET
jgi:hypothetical protein